MGNDSRAGLPTRARSLCSSVVAMSICKDFALPVDSEGDRQMKVEVLRGHAVKLRVRMIVKVDDSSSLHQRVQENVDAHGADVYSLRAREKGANPNQPGLS
jgi:hypothetical protein